MKKKLYHGLFWILLVLAIGAVLVLGVCTLRGYRMYRSALDRQPVDQMVASMQSKDSYTTLDRLPPLYKNAVLAAEDHRFYSHNGIDLISLARAVWNNIRTFSLREGGSTITQQLAKNVYFTQERRLERKIAELFMARKLEQELEKDTILELYINCIYYGSGHYCISDAARGYFGKEPTALNDYECTLLAGLPNAPSVYDPTVNPHLAEQRRQQVLEKMVRHGFLSQQEAKEMGYEKVD